MRDKREYIAKTDNNLLEKVEPKSSANYNTYVTILRVIPTYVFRLVMYFWSNLFLKGCF